MTLGKLPWRVGNRVPQHVYDADGAALITLPTAELAALVVRCVNGEAVLSVMGKISKIRLNHWVLMADVTKDPVDATLGELAEFELARREASK